MIFEKKKNCVVYTIIFIGSEKLNFLIGEVNFWKIKNFFLTLVYMTHEKNNNIIYNNMEYNRYMTDDRNQNSGNPITRKNSKFCNYDNCDKTAIYNYWGMKPKFCLDHKKINTMLIYRRSIYYVHIIIYYIVKK